MFESAALVGRARAAKERWMSCPPGQSPIIEMLSGHRVSVSVLIPCRNDAQNLPYVLGVMPRWVHEVVIIDDHCTDDTAAVARALAPDAVIVANEGSPGKGHALAAGMKAASGDALVHLDGNGSADPAEITNFVGALLAGADYARGSRFVPGGGAFNMPRLRRGGHAAVTWLARALFGGDHPSDVCYGYHGYWARVAPLLLTGESADTDTAINLRAAQAGLAIAEVPSYQWPPIHADRQASPFSRGWRVLKTIWHLRVLATPFAGRARSDPVVAPGSPASLARRAGMPGKP
jgi:hypothetical protein